MYMRRTHIIVAFIIAILYKKCDRFCIYGSIWRHWSKTKFSFPNRSQARTRKKARNLHLFSRAICIYCMLFSAFTRCVYILLYAILQLLIFGIFKHILWSSCSTLPLNISKKTIDKRISNGKYEYECNLYLLFKYRYT